MRSFAIETIHLKCNTCPIDVNDAHAPCNKKKHIHPLIELMFADIDVRLIETYDYDSHARVAFCHRFIIIYDSVACICCTLYCIDASTPDCIVNKPKPDQTATFIFIRLAGYRLPVVPEVLISRFRMYTFFYCWKFACPNFETAVLLSALRWREVFLTLHKFTNRLIKILWRGSGQISNRLNLNIFRSWINYFFGWYWLFVVHWNVYLCENNWKLEFIFSL